MHEMSWGGASVFLQQRGFIPPPRAPTPPSSEDENDPEVVARKRAEADAEREAREESQGFMSLVR